MMRSIKLFMSSPSDVAEEQDAVRALVAEINDVIVFLAPSLDVRLEIIHYQTHAFPDIGAPQDVIDRQIPDDYDIHLGIMWMRCGTPTRNAASGTVHEFDLAMARREKTGRPIIMFYFSDEPPPSLPRTKDDIAQLSAVLEFRERLQEIGLTMSYPDRKSFRERVRVGLLRAVADIAKQQPANLEALSSRAEERSAVQSVPQAMLALINRYEETRRDMDSGQNRTKRMSEIVEAMTAEAPNSLTSLHHLLQGRLAGERLAAIAVLNVFPEFKYLDWLAERLDPELEKPFVGFQAAGALLRAVRSLPISTGETLQKALEKAMELAKRNPHDPPRIKMLELAQRELAARKER